MFIPQILVVTLLEWHLNLPLAPWYGGFFERLVKSVKDLLIKDLKGSRLSYEKMQTVLSECEAILNNQFWERVFII